MKKPVYCICESKGIDQLHGHRSDDLMLYFRYVHNTILLLPKSKISVVVQPGFMFYLAGTPKTDFSRCCSYDLPATRPYVTIAT